MNTLKWYSAIVVSLSTAIVFIDYVVSEFEDAESFWAFVIFTPVAIYLWKLIAQK